MTSAAKRKQLHQYIDVADDAKIEDSKLPFFMSLAKECNLKNLRGARQNPGTL
jgi:hypothetical protein